MPIRCATLPGSPVTKLSRQRTSQPSCNSRSQRCEPRNPAPPVTTARGRRAIADLPLASGRPVRPPANWPTIAARAHQPDGTVLPGAARWTPVRGDVLGAAGRLSPGRQTVPVVAVVGSAAVMGSAAVVRVVGRRLLVLRRRVLDRVGHPAP